MPANQHLKDLFQKMTAACNGEFGLFIPVATFNAQVMNGLQSAIAGVAASGGLPVPARGAAMSPSLPTGSKPVMSVRFSGGSIFVESSPFLLDVVLHKKLSATDVLSTVRFAFQTLVLQVVPRSNDLSFNVVDSTISSPVITPGANRDAVIAALGWSAEEKKTLEQFEGFVAFTGKGTLVPVLASMIAPPPLVIAFSGVRFVPINVSVLSPAEVGDGILITTSAASALLPPGCVCDDGEFATKTTGSAGGGSYPLALTIGTRPNPPIPAPSLTSLRTGISFYTLVPQRLASLSFGPQVFPAITIGDGGSFAGFEYRWDGVVSFQSFSLSIDTADPALIIQADCNFRLDASAWINLPCNGRLDVGSGTVTGGINNVSIRVRLLLDVASQTIRFDSALENHNVNNLVANIHLAGFPIDNILDLVIAHNAPGMISGQLRDAVNRGRFVIGDLSKVIPAFGRNMRTSSFFTDTTGVLLGVHDAGD